MVKKKLLTIATGLAVSLAVLASSATTAFAYEVKSGDTLSKISAETGVSVDEIMKLNGITNVNQIWAGENLRMSSTDTTPASRDASGNVIGFKKGIQKTTYINANLKKTLLEMFDAEYYAKQNPDVVAALGNSKEALFAHFCNNGIWEGRQVNENFNVSAYASAYGDLKTAFSFQNTAQQILSYYQHYATFGKNENRPVTTIAAAQAAGITVTSVATQGGETVGTVIASAPQAQSPEEKKNTRVSLGLASAAHKVAFEKYEADMLALAAKWGLTLPSRTGNTIQARYEYITEVVNVAVGSEAISRGGYDYFEYTGISETYYTTRAVIGAAALQGKYDDYFAYMDALRNYERSNPCPAVMYDEAAYEAAITSFVSSRKTLADFHYVGEIVGTKRYYANAEAATAAYNAAVTEFDTGKSAYSVKSAPATVSNPGATKPDAPTVVSFTSDPGAEPENPTDVYVPNTPSDPGDPGTEPARPTGVAQPTQPKPADPGEYSGTTDPGEYSGTTDPGDYSGPAHPGDVPVQGEGESGGDFSARQVAYYNALREYESAHSIWQDQKNSYETDYTIWQADVAAYNTAHSSWQAQKDLFDAWGAYEADQAVKTIHDVWAEQKYQHEAWVAYTDYQTKLDAYNTWLQQKALYDEYIQYLEAKEVYDHYDSYKAAYDQYVSDVAAYEAYQAYLATAPVAADYSVAEYDDLAAATNAYNTWYITNPMPVIDDFITPEYAAWETARDAAVDPADYMDAIALYFFRFVSG